MASFSYGRPRTVAVIDDETKAAVEGKGINESLNQAQRAYLDKASKGLLEIAENIMNSLSENEMKPSAVTREGATYSTKAVVTAVPTRLYNKETGERDIPKLDDNGRQMVTFKIKIPNQTDFINLYADTNINNGVNITNISVSQWQKNNEGKNFQKTYLRNDINSAPLHQSTKDICRYICDTIQTLERPETVAYIDKDSRAAISGKSHDELTPEQRAFLAKMGNELVAKAEAIISDLAANGLTPSDKTKEREEYDTKAVITVLPSYKFNKETGENDIPVLKKDKTPIYDLRITLTNKQESIFLHSNEDGKLTSLSAGRWEANEQTGKNAFRYYTGKELSGSREDGTVVATFSESTQAIAQYIKDKVLEPTLSSLAYDFNQRLKQTTDKVFNEKGELVNDAYAKYINDEYGERIQLKAHNSKVVVELGETADGSRYAKAIDFGAPKSQNNTFPYAFINTAQDITAETVPDRDLAALVAEYKGIPFDKEKDYTQPTLAPAVQTQSSPEPVQNEPSPEIPPLKEYGDKLNVEFKAAGGKSYANFEEDHNRLVIYNRDYNLTVSLGTTKKGEPYVMATDFTKKDENDKPVSHWVNNAKDALEHIPVREIAEIAADYKGFSLDGKEAARPNNSKNNLDDIQR